MKSKDATFLEMKQLNDSSKKWFIEVPMKINNEREIVRRATREVDPPIRLSRKIDWIDIAILSVCGVAVIAHLTLSFGWLDFLVKK